jgi:ribosomal protein L31E
MPKYRVSDPNTGVTLQLEGDSPPTEAELVEIFSKYQKPAAPAPAPAQPRAAAPEAAIPSRRLPAIGNVGDRATGFRQQVEETGMTPQERQASVRGFAGFTGSLLAGPVLGSLVRGAGTAFPVLQRFTTPLATSLETGGFRTGLPATTSRTTRAVVSGAGGAGAAGGGALVTDPEAVTEAAAVGTLLPQVLPPAAKVLAKGGGAVVDALSGRTPDIRANELIRTAANNEVNALRQAIASRQIPMRDAQPDVPVSRLIADLDMPVLQALLARAEQRDPQQVVNAFRKRESQDIVNELTRIAGGPTAETARAARETAKESLSELTGRIREESLGKARETGKVVPKLERIAVEARAASKEATDTVRRLSNAVNKSDDWAQNWVTRSRMVEQEGGGFAREYGRGIGEPGVRLPARGEQRYTYPGQLAMSGRQTTVGGPFERQVIDEGGVIAGRISKAAEKSVREGARARAAEATLRMKTQRGEVPITVGKLTSAVNSALNKPDIAANSQATAALNRINNMLVDRGMETGIIDPADVYAIRKWGVSSVIDELNPGADAKAKKMLTAKVLSEIKTAFDESIENAGGKEFANYLRSFERGMSDITGMELADNIRKLYAKGTPESKQQIIDLVRGESPDVIEDLFGSGRYQISKEMAKDMPFLTKLADTLNLDRKAVEQAAAGRAALTEAEGKASVRVRLPFLTRASTTVNEVVAGLEKKMKAETMDVLIRAAQSGREFNRVLNQIPARERNVFLKQFKNAESWNKFAGQVAQAAQVQVTSRAAKDYQEAPVMMNSLAPSAVNQLRP